MLLNELDGSCKVTVSLGEDGDGRSISLTVFEKVSAEENVEMYQIKKNLQAKNAIYAVFEPIIVRGTPLRLDSSTTKFSLGAVCKGKMHYWENITIKTVDFGRSFCYIATSKNESVTINRRDNYRLLLNIKSSIVMDDNVDLAVIKDISIDGIGLFTRRKDIDDLGKELDIVFQDGNETYKLNATVVRQDNKAISSGKLIGCKVNASNKNIEKFIYEKQRKRLSAHKGKGSK